MTYLVRLVDGNDILALRIAGVSSQDVLVNWHAPVHIDSGPVDLPGEELAGLRQIQGDGDGVAGVRLEGRSRYSPRHDGCVIVAV